MIGCPSCGAFGRPGEACPSCGASARRASLPTRAALLLGLAACGVLKGGSTNVDYGVTTFGDTDTDADADTDTASDTGAGD